MSDELDQFRNLRPQVPPPTSRAREAALGQLRAAALRDRETGQPASSRRSRRRPGPYLGLVISLAASVAVVIGVGAIAILAHTHRHPGSHPGQRSNAGGSNVRGQIVWQDGEVLAGNRVSHIVQVNAVQLPGARVARTGVYQRLASILGVSTTATDCQIAGRGEQRLAKLPCDVAQQQALAPRGVVTVAMDISLRVIDQIVHQADRLPGISTRATHTRAYPSTSLAAQILGTVSPITRAELNASLYPGASARSLVGQSGLEAEYDRYLRAGDTLQTSLRSRLQQTGQQALRHAITTNRPANGGAFVALNPQDGSVYAMGSLPSYDPNILTSNHSQATYDRLISKVASYPLLNRAIDSVEPTGSTFKPITATAALESHAWSTGQIYDDTGKFCIGNQCRQNAGGASNGPINLVNAIQVSSDTFFENLGARTNINNPIAHPQGGALQSWAKAFGIGQKTGIDLPGEVLGTLPSPAWRASRNQLEYQCDHALGQFKGHPKHPAGGCGIADGTNRPWSIGDNVSLAVGQGDVQVTPLQLAVAYAAIANGGTIVRPHIANTITSPGSTVVQKMAPPALRHIDINPRFLQTVRAGLRAAATQPGGTSDDVFGNFPEPVYGKAGTAQSTGQADSAWYAGYVPASATHKPIVVVVSVDQGGFGDVSAAPVARQILNQWFYGKPGPYVAGSSKTL